MCECNRHSEVQAVCIFPDIQLMFGMGRKVGDLLSAYCIHSLQCALRRIKDLSLCENVLSELFSKPCRVADMIGRWADHSSGVVGCTILHESVVTSRHGDVLQANGGFRTPISHMDVDQSNCMTFCDSPRPDLTSKFRSRFVVSCFLTPLVHQTNQ